ncbi:hypothetical protein ACJJTC_019127 [Scirpophaga incertulas]
MAGGAGAGAVALSGLGGSLEDKECDLLCPVCFELISEAYVTRCGHSFCFACVARAVELQRRCPKCGAALSSREHIFPNFLLNELVAKRRLRSGRSGSVGGASGSADTALGDSEAAGEEGVRLRALVAANARHLALGDVDRLLELLARRRRLLKASCRASQHRLLLQFLRHLLAARTAQRDQLHRECALVQRDMEYVSGVLRSLKEDADSMVGDGLDEGLRAELQELSVALTDPDLVSGSEPAPGGGDEESFAGGGDALAARWKKLTAHFDDFVQCYFAHRADELYFPGSSPGTPAAPTPSQDLATATSASVQDVSNSTSTAPEPSGDPGSAVSLAEGSVKGLELFREDLAAFTRYRSLRPLATLSYCGDAINYSTIVSTIEFDKDDEYFAIAGVTKRIKVFEYEAVVRDAVDVHYPCAEMQCAHKVSCVSWNAYHKNVLASSDYEGTVSVWDAGTGQRTRALQEHDKRCWSVHFNRADVRLLASGSDDARVKLWALNAERSVGTLEARFNVCCVRFNPRSSAHLAFGSADHCVHYYDLRAPRAPLQVFRDHRKAVSYVQFLDSQTLVSASTDSQLKLWKLSSPRCVRSFTGHANEKNFVGLATDGQYVACGSENNALYLYYSGLSRPLLTYRFEAVRGFLEKERRDEEPSDFVSAVCWRRSRSPALLAANSQGHIKVLELV